MRRRALLLLLWALQFPLLAKFKPLYNFYNYAYGTRAFSLGNAFTAVADDLSAVFWNPAGITQIRTPEFYLSYKTMDQSQDYDLQVRETATSRDTYTYTYSAVLNQIDFFSVAVPVGFWNVRGSFALSYYRYIPYGAKGMSLSALSISAGTEAIYRRQVRFYGSDGCDVLAFSVATALNPYVSVGITLQQFFNTGSITLIHDTAPKLYDEQLTDKIEGRTFVFGILFHPFDFMSLGFAYHTRLHNRLDTVYLYRELDEYGQEISKYTSTCVADIFLPAHYSLGMRLQPLKGLGLSADFSRIAWSQGRIDNYYDKPPQLPFPRLDDYAFSQRDVENRRCGAEIALPFKKMVFFLRGGYSADRQLYVDNNDRQVKVNGYTLGLGATVSPSLTLEVGFQRQSSVWPETGYFVDGRQVQSRYRANVFSFAIIYDFHITGGEKNKSTLHHLH